MSRGSSRTLTVEGGYVKGITGGGGVKLVCAVGGGGVKLVCAVEGGGVKLVCAGEEWGSKLGTYNVHWEVWYFLFFVKL